MWGDLSWVEIDTNVGAAPPYVRIARMVMSDGSSPEAGYFLDLTSTPCYFGGERYWFLCPFCGDRVGVLYLGGKKFGCRRCYNLAYKSQYAPRGGLLAPVAAYFDLIEDVEKLEKEKLARTQYWHGRPTKRYARYLQKLGRIQSIDGNAMVARLTKALSAQR